MEDEFRTKYKIGSGAPKEDLRHLVAIREMIEDEKK